ncbi:MAG: 6-bladed beta-propeller, partial [Pseudomonas sp.]
MITEELTSVQLRIHKPMTARSSSSCAALLLAATVVACNSEDRALARWQGTIDTLPGGIIRVSSPEAGVWQEKERWRIVEEMRIGRTEGSGPDVFSSVVALGVSPSGTIAIIDGPTQELRLFDKNGQHIRTLGRRGSGPAEFQFAHGLVWDHLGRLWVVDPGNSRYTVFDSSGALVFDRRRNVPGVVYPWLGAFARDGYLYDVAGQLEADDRRVFIYFRVDTLGNVIDSLPKLEYRPQRSVVVPATMFDISPRMTFRFDRGGYIWFGDTGDYKIVQRTLAGDTIRMIERAFTPIHLTEQEKDSLWREVPA